MERPAPAAEGWTLTPEAFEKLLGLLDPDPTRAGARYELLRTKLIKLFQWRGASHPEELADETINRVARKIDEGVEVRAADPYIYFQAVALRLFKETARREEKERVAIASLSKTQARWQAMGIEAPEDCPQELLARLQGCLDELTATAHRLALGYYAGQGSHQVASRERLAAELGISVNALRIRAHRIRGVLERCVTDWAGS